MLADASRIALNDQAESLYAGPVELVFDLDVIPSADPAVYDAYLEHVLAVLTGLRRTGAFKDVSIRLRSSDAVRVDQALARPDAAGLLGVESGLPQVHLALPENFAADRPNLPMGRIEPGSPAAFRAYAYLAVLAGRWAFAHPGETTPDFLTDLYRRFLDTETAADGDLGRALGGFLAGRTGPQILGWAKRFALPAVKPVPWSKLLQYFRNIERMVGQAA